MLNGKMKKWRDSKKLEFSTSLCIKNKGIFMIVLAFDTSNKPLTVAVVRDGQALAHAESTENRTHSISLLPDIQQVLTQAGLSLAEVDAIAVAQGPGSYTGVRLAVTTAKVLADTAQKKLIGVSSLKLLAANGDPGKLVVPLMDARNDNAFAAAYQFDGLLTEVIADQHIAMSQLLEQLTSYDESKLEFVNATPKLTELIKAKFPQAKILSTEESLPDAVKLAQLAATTQPVADIDSFVPTYLRLTQAEHDWYQKGHQEDGNISYVEEV